MEYLPYIVGFVTALGVAKLLQMAYAARIERRKIKSDLEITNAGKAIDADVEALNMFKDRLKQVETDAKERDAKHEADIKALNEKFEKLSEAHTLLMLENEKAKSDAHHAETEMTRQAGEILSLRQRNHTLSDEIQKRDAKLTLLEARILHLESLLTQYQTGHTISTDDTIKVELVEHE
jgi:chromosome segregation ATPase